MTEKLAFKKKQLNIVNELISDLREGNGLTAIAIGGSFARGISHPSSDIDIGLYYQDDNPFDIEDIRTIAQKFNDEAYPMVSGYYEWGKWVNGGAWLTIKGQRVDLIYRSLDTLQKWIDKSKEGLIELDYYQQPATGFYSYIYLAEITIAVPLWDSQKSLHKLKEQITVYPRKLKEKILTEFMKMAKFNLYHAEIASSRNDIYMLVGCLHRIIACIVQVIYAQNEHYFISDKGSIAECMTFKNKPNRFDEIVNQILSTPTNNSAEQLQSLLKIIKSNNQG